MNIVILNGVSQDNCAVSIVTASIPGNPPPAPGPAPNPIPAPTPQPTPAGCNVIEANWESGTSPADKPNFRLEVGQQYAFKVRADKILSKSQGGTRYGSFQFYELNMRVEWCVTNAPCAFGGMASGAVGPVPSASIMCVDTPSPPSGYFQVPLNEYLYINVRPVDTSGSTFLLFE